MEVPNQHNHMGMEAFSAPQLGSFGVFLTFCGGLRGYEGHPRAMGWPHTTGGHFELLLPPASIPLSINQATLMTACHALDQS